MVSGGVSEGVSAAAVSRSGYFEACWMVILVCRWRVFGVSQGAKGDGRT
jgi:hypothetical protein